MYTKKRNGLRIDPCGRLLFDGVLDDLVFVSIFAVVQCFDFSEVVYDPSECFLL